MSHFNEILPPKGWLNSWKCNNIFLITIFFPSAVPAASMTRLVRSRTASGSSVHSFDGNRSRSHTNEGNRSRSHTNEGPRSRSHTGDHHQRSRAHTDHTMETSNNSTVEQAAPKSAEVSC